MGGDPAVKCGSVEMERGTGRYTNQHKHRLTQTHTADRVEYSNRNAGWS